MKSPTLLVILDGFGYSPKTSSNAIHHAPTPHLDQWMKTYPHALLDASGTAVGLLPGTIGTSEVGHLTIGCGRIIPESVLRIHQMIDDGTFFTNTTLVSNLEALKKTGGRLHLLGLLSDAGVHSHEKHMYALIKAARSYGIPVIIHPFLDGRDCPPKSAQKYLEKVENLIKKDAGVHLGSIHGRFYAMDRDKNWQRTEQSYATLTTPQPSPITSWRTQLDALYAQHTTDEFVPPFQLNHQHVIQPKDGVIFFNFRADRARQLTHCFVTPKTVPFSPQPPQLTFFITMTAYDHLTSTPVLLTKEIVQNTLKDTLSRAGKTIFSIAETEKYAHVTYFFGGGKEKEVPGETWTLIPSIKTRDYVHHPAMSAHAITKAVLTSLQQNPCDFYLINYANADMVGHSGNFEATKEAIGILDTELNKLYEMAVIKMNGTLYITSDHGNAECMFDEESGQPKTSHTLNQVPFIAIRPDYEHKKIVLPLTQLADIAGFILKNMGITNGQT